MTPLDIIPLLVFAKTDAIAGAIGGMTRSLAIRDVLIRVVISAIIGGSVAYYLSPLVTIIMVIYVKDYPEVAEYLIDNARNPIGFFIGFTSMYLTTIVDMGVTAIGRMFGKKQGGGSK